MWRSSPRTWPGLLLALMVAAGCPSGHAGTTSTPATTVPATTTTTMPPAAATATTTSTLPVTAAAPTGTTVPVRPRHAVTEFFYWYDPATGAHITDGPLSLTLPDGALPHWRDPVWFQTEFADMAEAGIDIAACGYWPGEAWADDGPPSLVAGLDALAARGIDPPGAAMFYETVPLWGRYLDVDAVYTWGVAFLGFQPRDSVAGAGPGYDDTLVPGREPIVVPRDDGEYHHRVLYYALASGRDILWLET